MNGEDLKKLKVDIVLLNLYQGFQILLEQAKYIADTVLNTRKT